MPGAQTIKQAKASFAARGRPSLTAKEQHQLARSLQLEQRAEHAKEQAKRKAAAAKKRSENEVKGREERDLRMGTQRRKDRFGYVSSQYHLGAFLLGSARRKVEKGEKAEEDNDDDDDDDDMFGDEELDDEVMLNALDVPAEKFSEHVQSDSVLDVSPPRPLVPTIRRSQSAPVMDEEAIEDFWDDLESSTQIARELGETEVEMQVTGKSTSTRSASFGSVDFDLTAEDLELLDPPSVVQEALPGKSETLVPSPLARDMVQRPQPIKATMPPPAIPSGQAARTNNALPPSRWQANTTKQALQSRETNTSMKAPHARETNTTMKVPQPRETNIAVKAPQSRDTNITMRTPQPRDTNTTTRRPTSIPMVPPMKTSTFMPPSTKPAAKSVSFDLTGPRTPATMTLRDARSMPPPALKRLHSSNHQQPKPRNAIKGPFLPASSLYCSPDLGFTLTQLESFVDDDIQLTQVVAG